MNADEEWETWQAWLGDEPKGETIYAQVLEMLAFRQIWDIFAYVYENAPPEVRDDATFRLWFRVAIARSQAMSVRRMADKSSDVVSLAHLIDQVWRYPWVLTRQRHVAMRGNDDDMLELADRRFSDMAGPGDYIDPQIPAKDYADLQAKTATVRKWVNTSVAHLTQKSGRPKEGPPLQAVHDAVDTVADLFQKYQVLIQGVAVDDGVIMEPWPYVFRYQWIADDEAFDDVMSKLDESARRRRERRQQH